MVFGDAQEVRSECLALGESRGNLVQLLSASAQPQFLQIRPLSSTLASYRICSDAAREGMGKWSRLRIFTRSMKFGATPSQN